MRKQVDLTLTDVPATGRRLISLGPVDEVSPGGKPSKVAAVVALVAALVFVIGPFVAGSDDKVPAHPDAQTAPTPRDPVAIGDAMVRAIGTRDVTAAASLLRDDAVVVAYGASDVSEFVQLLEWFDATDWRVREPACEFGPPNQVTCAVLQSNAWSEAAGVEPVETQISMSITDDLISSISYTDDDELWTVAVVDPFLQFVKAHHFADITSMWFLTRGQLSDPILDDESIRMFAQYTGEYADWAEPPGRATSVGDAMVRAIHTRDATAAQRLLSDDAVVIVFGAGNSTDFVEQFAWLDATDWRFQDRSCEFAPPNRVLCAVHQSNAWSDAAGIDPVEGQFSMSISKGLIRSISYTKDRATWNESVLEPFVQFVSDRDPAHVSSMWDIAGDGVGHPRFDSEAVALFQQHTADYTRAAGSR